MNTLGDVVLAYIKWISLRVLALVLWIVALFMVFCGATYAKSSSQRHSTPTPKSGWTDGCPVCCCEVKVPQGATPETTISYCLRSSDKECANMCREWLKKNHKKAAQDVSSKRFTSNMGTSW